MNLTSVSYKIVHLAAIAAACFLGATQGSAQTLLLRYNFDESASGTANALDSGAAPAAEGVFMDGATRTSNTPGGASTGALDAVIANTYVTAEPSETNGDLAKINGLTAFTLSAWINLQANPVHGNRIMSKQLASGSFDGFSFALNRADDFTISASRFQLNLALGGTGTPAFHFTISGADLDADNKWIFVAVTYDGNQTTDNVKFYSGDTTLQVAQTGFTRSAAAGTLLQNTLPLRVAAQSQGTASAPILIDDARIYSGVLDVATLDAVRLENLQSTPNAVLITNPNRSGNTVTFSFDSETGRTHTVEYKNTLNDALWQTLTIVIGDGTSKQVTDATAIPATRFYRVVTQ